MNSRVLITVTGASTGRDGPAAPRLRDELERLIREVRQHPVPEHQQAHGRNAQLAPAAFLVQDRVQVRGTGDVGSSQSSNRAGSMITGCRRWMSASAGAVAVVMTAKDSKNSPSLLHRLHSAANDSGASASKKGCLPCPICCYSNHPLAGTKHRRERSASPNDGLVWTDSSRALMRCVLIRPSLEQAGVSPQAELGDGAVPVLIETAGREVLRGSAVVVRLKFQRQHRPPQPLEVVDLSLDQLLCERAAHQ